MKTVIFVGFCYIMSLSDAEQITTPKVKNITVEDRPSKLKRSYLECIDETHVRPHLVRRYSSGIGWSDDPSLKKWALCVLYRMDLMSPQGVFRYDTAMADVPLEDRELVDKILDRCLSKKAKPPHEIAWNYLSCFKSRDRKRRFPTLGIFY